MLEEAVKKYYLEHNKNCAEGVLLGANEYYGLGLNGQAVKAIAGFGKGCGCGKTCGAIAGALAVLSLLSVEGDAHSTPGFDTLCAGLVQRLEDALGGMDCAVLRPKYVREGVRCADCVTLVSRILEEYLLEQGTVK